MLRAVIVIHRWLGVALSLLVFVWFLSGIGMMYFPFPSVTPADRLARAAAIDPDDVVLTPEEAAAKADVDLGSAEVRLNTFDGRPAYRFAQGRRGDVLVFADTGETRGPVTKEMRDRIASGWTGRPVEDARVEGVESADQWTVQASLRPLRPLWKYSWPSGEELYLSGASGDVVQYTTTASRLGAYLGPIPHWIYFTPLRTRQLAWSRLVIWTSGLATVAAMLGLVIGVSMYSPSRQYRYRGAPSRLPYAGQKRWHAAFGLVFGVATVTWAFSGLLSMDPFPSLAGGPAPAARERPSVPQALRGRVENAAFAVKSPRQALEQLAPAEVKELEFTSFDDEPIYLATLAGGATRIVPMSGEPFEAFDTARIIDIVMRVAPGAETELLTQYDRYYLDRTRLRPLPALLARMNDEAGTRYYIDPGTGRVVGSYSNRNWVSRWLYNGLHSLNFPWLYNHRPLWDIVVISFMLGGAALAVTSLVLAWQVVGRKIRNLGAKELRN